MTKKDFELIAGVLRHCQKCAASDETVVIDWVSECMAEALADTNPRFDTERFLQASGVFASATTMQDAG